MMFDFGDFVLALCLEKLDEDTQADLLTIPCACDFYISRQEIKDRNITPHSSRW